MTTLYLVYAEGFDVGLSPPEDAVELSSGLWLVKSRRTRSELYHSVKRHFAPQQLLVAPLSGLPKFKGMKPGTTRAALALCSHPH